MSVDFQQIYRQVRNLGDTAIRQQALVTEKRALAQELLEAYATAYADLQQKVTRVVRQADPNLRCAVPFREPLTAAFPRPEHPDNVVAIAADGSQINPDRHAAVEFSLINVGAVTMELGRVSAPQTYVQGQLMYADQMYTETGRLTDGTLALMRDLSERSFLLDLAASFEHHQVITFTDGPLELWGAKDVGGASQFQKNLRQYLRILHELRKRKVVTAGYIDKPGANMAVRLLEVMMTPEEKLAEIRSQFPLRYVTDEFLYSDLLPRHHRSAIFKLQSSSAADYGEALNLYFFYLNVGRQGQPDLARIEIPAWVADDTAHVDALHAVLVQQCEILGSRAYPYLLHRAHEAALVSRDEKEQVNTMIELELRRRGVLPGRVSPKQAVKGLAGRQRFRA